MWMEEIITRHGDWQRIYWISIGGQPIRGDSPSLELRRKAKNLILKTTARYEMLHRALHLPESVIVSSNKERTNGLQFWMSIGNVHWLGRFRLDSRESGQGLLEDSFQRDIEPADSKKCEREWDVLTRLGTVTLPVFNQGVGRNQYIIILQTFIII